jgi:hypothetical protein
MNWLTRAKLGKAVASERTARVFAIRCINKSQKNTSMSDWHTISLSDAARRLFQGCIAAASKVLRTRSAIASINV